MPPRSWAAGWMARCDIFSRFLILGVIPTSSPPTMPAPVSTLTKVRITKVVASGPSSTMALASV